MLQAMQAEGLSHPGDLIPDGVIHRFTPPTDRPGSNKAWYILFDSEPPAGAFGRWVGDHNQKSTWCGKVTKSFTPEEKQAYARKQAEVKRLCEQELARLQAECAEWCTNAWNDAAPASLDHPYLVRKQIQPHGIRQYKTTLMVPCSISGKITGIQFISPDGSKKFKRNAVKQGACFLIGNMTPTVVICEGFATGASIYEATGHAVLVAFDAGNLLAVAETARKRLPDADIIIAADNDAWAKISDADGKTIEYRPVPCEVDGKPRVNTGIVRAKEAAAAVNGRVVGPRFGDASSHPTDFNDLHTLEGLERVKWAFALQEEYEPPLDDDDHMQVCEDPSPETAPPLARRSPFDGAPFALLGHDRGTFYYLPSGAGQITALKESQHCKPQLMTLAPLNWWEGSDFIGKTGLKEDMAKNALFQESYKIGIYDPDRVRGLGAWEDRGRSVLHMGDSLLVDGRNYPLHGLNTHFLYERGLSIADEKTDPLRAGSSSKLIELCEMLSWEKAINGRLLAGWCVASIICGSLSWRPHIHITGPSGTGKSWIIDNIIKMVGGQYIKSMLGSTSEAGLRRALKNDAFSVFFDEFEAENANAANRIQEIYEYGRACSCNSDAKIIKAKQGGGVDTFTPRSCLGVGSVNVIAKQRADTSRWSILTLIKDPKGDDKFNNMIEPFWMEHITQEFARGIRSRAIMLIPTVNRNFEPFQRAVTAKLGDRRQGDQYGSLLACAYSLRSSNVVTLDFARGWVNEQSWDGHQITAEQTDERRCLNKITEALIQENGSTLSVAELLELATREDMVLCGEDKGKISAQKTLERHGIKATFTDMFMVSNTHTGIAHILKDTPWASNWGNILSRVVGAHKHPTSIRIGGAMARVTAIPLHYVIKGKEEE